jgi:hypothetical protein
VFIGPVVNPDAINAMSNEDAVSYFEGLSGWVEVEEIEDLGERGDSAEEIVFTAVGNRRARKLKGPRNAGTQALVVGRDPLDDGQQELVAAEATDFNRAFKTVYSDKVDASHTDSVEYYAGLVMSKPTNLGNVSNVTRRTFNVAINTGIYDVESEASVAPTNTLLPAISGIAASGQVLTAFEGKWTGEPTFTFQWKADGTNIGGATGRTYTVVGGNAGKAITVAVTGTNGAGNATATSAPTVNIPA